MLALLATVVGCWAVEPARWRFVAALGALLAADTITFTLHYPRNKILFTAPLSTDDDLLRRVARGWARGNYVRLGLAVLALLSGISGAISLGRSTLP